ncbi:hypothetical protein D9M72_550640 [compost metagenome]
MHLGIAGETADWKRFRPFDLYCAVRILTKPRQFEHHAGGAAHVEPAIVGARLHRHALILVIREDRAQDIERRELAATDRSDRVFDFLLTETMQRRL